MSMNYEQASIELSERMRKKFERAGPPERSGVIYLADIDVDEAIETVESWKEVVSRPLRKHGICIQKRQID